MHKLARGSGTKSCLATLPRAGAHRTGAVLLAEQLQGRNEGGQRGPRDLHMDLAMQWQAEGCVKAGISRIQGEIQFPRLLDLKL